MSSPAVDIIVAAPLSQGAGFGILIGLGALFALGMWVVANLLGKFQNEIQGSEMFMTAKRSIGTGLIASAVVSGWTIAATLLTSTSWTYEFGVSGAYFYAAGASVQIFVFAVTAIELKRRAPGAHTFLEVAKIRYGRSGHCIQILYSTLLQIINCVNILVGLSAVFTALTGMSQLAAVWLLPPGVVIYTLTGGIKATFLTDYVHTIIIYAMILTGLFVVYSQSILIGSPDAMFQLLKDAAQRAPVAGNAGGEYLTMSSQNGILLGVVFWCAVFGSTVDVQLFQKAIAANPASTLPGYIVGGLAWFTVPFCLATTFGLAARALENNPAFPTYPRPMSTNEINQGLALPFAAETLLGKGGAFFVLLIVFMACTSGWSADVVAVASVYTYDVYGTYINPKATGGRLLKVSQITIVVWAVFIAALASIITQKSTISVNYLVTIMGVFTCSMVFPMYSTVLWKKQNKIAQIAAPILGSITGFSCWLGSAKALEGVVTVESTGQVLPLVIGNGTSLLCGILYSLFFTYAFGPDDFDWDLFKTGIRVTDDSDVKNITAEQLAQQLKVEHLSPEEERGLRKGKKVGIGMATALCTIFVILIPLPMLGTHYVFSRDFFRLWVAITFIVGWVATLTITLMPLWQGRHTIRLFGTYLFRGNKGLMEKLEGAREREPEKESQGVTVVEEVE